MSIHFSMGISCGEEFKEQEVVLIDESRDSTRQRISMDVQVQHPDQFELEFWPVEHPLEPQDEDRPVKCPIPAASSVLNDSKMQEERLADSFRKRAEVPLQINGEGIDVNIDPPIRAVRKRHHRLTHNDDDDDDDDNDHKIKPLMRMPPLPPLQTKKFTIFEMLNDFDKFGS